jgi:RHS repeat-associated protein
LTAAGDSTSGRIEFGYDGLDRLTQELTPQGTVEYLYDTIGRRTNMIVNGQTPVSYQYDSASRLTQVTQGTQVVGLGYDAAGRRTSLSYPNGVETSYSYDQASRILQIEHLNTSTQQLIERLNYTYDAAGNRISFTRTNGTATLLPDAVQAAYDAANEQIQFNNPTPNLTYDASWNLISQTDASGTTTYMWDARNRLVAISGPGVSASFVYDALGRRISKTINGVVTDFQYDGNDIVAEAGGSSIDVTYLRSLNIDEPFVRQAGENEFYHTDVLGSSLVLSDSSGLIDTTYEYEAFGKTTINGTSLNPFQYAGRENDGAGTYYHRTRYYGTTFHRFISKDPIGFAGGDINLYAYVLNNPVKYIDPFGLDVTLAYYPTFATHIGVGVNSKGTVGFYPQKQDLLTRLWVFGGFETSGELKFDIGKPTKIITIKTSPKQDKAMEAVIFNRLVNPGKYKLYGRNCATFASDVLKAGGLKAPNTIDPGLFIFELEEILRKKT